MKYYWDPVYDKIAENKFDEINRKYFKYYEKYKNKNKTNIPFVFISILIIIATFTLIALKTFGFSSNDYRLLIIFFPLTILSTIFLAFHIKYIKINHKISAAKNNGWLFNPSKNHEHFNLFKQKFPKLLSIGNKNYFYDEFWGESLILNQKTNFYSSSFNYKLDLSKDAKHYKRKIFALHFPLKKSGDFLIAPKKITNYLTIKLNQKEIQTESNKFNNYFSILPLQTDQNQTFAFLSPAVINILINIRENFGDFYLRVKNRTLIFIFLENEIEEFSKNSNNGIFSKENENIASAKINSYLKISSKLLKYLN